MSADLINELLRLAKVGFGYDIANPDRAILKRAAAALAAKDTALSEMRAELEAICKEVGCTTKPGVALRFVNELRRNLQRSYERQTELLRTWDDASLTERQELDRLRRGWGPSTPTERMARRTDLLAAMTAISHAMDAVVPDDKTDEDFTVERFQEAYDKLNKGYRVIIDLLHAIPELNEPEAVDGY